MTVFAALTCTESFDDGSDEADELLCNNARLRLKCSSTSRCFSLKESIVVCCSCCCVCGVDETAINNGCVFFGVVVMVTLLLVATVVMVTSIGCACCCCCTCGSHWNGRAAGMARCPFDDGISIIGPLGLIMYCTCPSAGNILHRVDSYNNSIPI